MEKSCTLSDNLYIRNSHLDEACTSLGQHTQNQIFDFHLQTQAPSMALFLVNDLTTTKFPKPESWHQFLFSSFSLPSSMIILSHFSNIF